MPIAIAEIIVGRCYATANNQHRRILSIEENKVTYESWGGNVKNYQEPLTRNTVNIQGFAESVDRVIDCP